ncbi:unnamed protein product [Dicrocoelium dendriticum]|nr:unnamed protein product [Dicrocoelium dendriticum]
MGFVGDDLTGEWLSEYGSATEVMGIAKTTCRKYDKMTNTQIISGKKNFTCVVTGPRRGDLIGEFNLQFETDEADTFSITKEDLEKRNTGTGYDITDLQVKVRSATD